MNQIIRMAAMHERHYWEAAQRRNLSDAQFDFLEAKLMVLEEAVKGRFIAKEELKKSPLDAWDEGIIKTARWVEKALKAKPCRRCGGSGRVERHANVMGGVCFRCKGEGF